MAYIDSFIFPLQQIHLEEYQSVAERVAAIWLEYGALEYQEYKGDDMSLPGVRSFAEVLNLAEDETAIFGWAMFPDKASRDRANAKVSQDPRMREIVAPLMNPDRLVFDASRMVYGGFSPLVRVIKES